MYYTKEVIMSTIDASDFKEVADLRSKLSTVVNEVGQYQLQIELLQFDITDLQQKISEQSSFFKQLLKKEEELIKRLSEKYGAGSINFETGEFTPEK